MEGGDKDGVDPIEPQLPNAIERREKLRNCAESNLWENIPRKGRDFWSVSREKDTHAFYQF